MFKTSKDYTIYEIKLLKIIKEAFNTYTYVFTKPHDLSWSEGAHTHLALDEFDHQLGWWQKKHVRHFSIMSLESENVVSITTRLPELHSEFKDKLKSAKLGDTFYLFKVGSRLKLRRRNKPIVLLSAGVGIASLKPLISAFKLNNEGIKSIHHINIDSSGEYLFKEDFEHYKNNDVQFTNDYVSTRVEFYHELNQLLKTKGLLESDFYIIGSDDFILSIRDVLKTYQISDDQLVLDKKDEFYELLKGKIS